MVDNTEKSQIHNSKNNNFFDDDIAYNATNIAYNLSQVTKQTLDTEYERYLSIATKNGWNILLNSEMSPETSAYNLRAAVFINKSKNALHFAFAGTDPTSSHDLSDDVLLWLNKPINKLHPMQLLINKVDEAIGAEKATNYSISSSGHSLGAVVSDLLAAEMLSQGRKFTMSTTFDNPGSKPIIEAVKKDNIFTNSEQLCLDDVANHCTAFLVKPNFINRTNPQIAKDTYLVSTIGIESQLRKIEKYEASSVLGKILTLVYNAVTSLPIINNIATQIDEHELTNFYDYQYRCTKVSCWDPSGAITISEAENPGLAIKIACTQPSTKKEIILKSEGDTGTTYMSFSQLAEALIPLTERYDDNSQLLVTTTEISTEDDNEKFTILYDTNLQERENNSTEDDNEKFTILYDTNLQEHENNSTEDDNEKLTLPDYTHYQEYAYNKTEVGIERLDTHMSWQEYINKEISGQDYDVCSHII